METIITITVQIEQHEDDYHFRKGASRKLRFRSGDYPFDRASTVRAVGDSAVEATKELVGGVPTRPEEGGR